jgi:O-acetyl-ADP-ribose deacetylase (regulator of RNase III)
MNLVTGDLIAMAKNGEFDIIVHGCNCWNVMGSGIAKQIRQAFPDAWSADKETLAGDRNKLGSYTLGIEGNLIIANAYTQYFTAKTAGEDVFEYLAFKSALDKLLMRFGNRNFGFPMIGMGLAGGNADRIIPMLYDFASLVNDQGGAVVLVEYSNE